MVFYFYSLSVATRHHGYDPDLPEMYTGFIGAGAGIINGGRIEQVNEPDIAPLVGDLLGISFTYPDGHLVPREMRESE